MQGAGIFKFNTLAEMNGYTPDPNSNSATNAYVIDEGTTYEWDGTNWVRLKSKIYNWYEGGESFRVWATINPFSPDEGGSYVKNATGNYSFSSGVDGIIDRVEFLVNTSGASQNIDINGQITINITGNSGNTTKMNTSTPHISINSPFGTGGNIAPSAVPASNNSTFSADGAGGTLTIIGSNLNTHTTGKVSIVNLAQDVK